MQETRKDPIPFQIRQAILEDAPRIAETHVASWVHAYSGIIPDEMLAKQAVGTRLAQWNALIPSMHIHPDRQTALVGVDPSGGVQGFIHGGVDREVKSSFDAEVYSFYLHPDVQGRGLGSRLFGHLTDWLQTHGHQSMRLWVLEKNPSRAFYERIGGTLLPDTQDIHFGGHATRQVSYGWKSVADLGGTLPR